jgi:tetratricopeptide (TPR) repeat protein
MTHKFDFDSIELVEEKTIMCTRRLTGLALLLLFLVISAPATQAQTNDKAKKLGESFVSDKLEKSVNAGFDNPEKLRNDPDINSLRADPRFSVIDKLSNTLSLSQFNDQREDHKDSADFNYSKERWAPEIVLYQSFLKSEPNNGRGWYNLGYALHYSREHTRAIAAWNRALALGYQKPVSSYNIACAYAMLDQRDAAFDWLDRAFQAGFELKNQLIWDRDLDNLRSDPRFQRFLENASFNSKNRSPKEFVW